MRFAGYVFHHVIPILLVVVLRGNGNHFQRILSFFAGTNIHTVAATQAIEHIHLNTESGSFELFSLRFQQFNAFAQSFLFFFIENERTNGGVRTNISALVALDAVIGIPNRNRNGNAAFFESRCAVFPRSVFATYENRNRQIVSALGVYGANDLLNKFRRIVLLIRINFQICPFCRNFHFFDITSAINGGIIHLNNLLASASIRFHDKFLHLLHRLVVRNYVGYFEKCRL